MLHLSIRSQDNAIVRNHYHNKQWGNEERSGQNPIQANEPFEILILAEDISYKIAVNGIHFCQFNHRLPLNLAKFISIEGSCEIQYILIENDIKGNVISHQQIRPTAPSMSSHDIRQPSNLPKPIPMPRPLHPPFPIPANSPNTAMINRERIQTFPIAVPRNPHNSISYNPAIPFCCPINGGMRVGMMVMVKGQILSHNGRYVVISDHSKI